MWSLFREDTTQTSPVEGRREGGLDREVLGDGASTARSSQCHSKSRAGMDLRAVCQSGSQGKGGRALYQHQGRRAAPKAGVGLSFHLMAIPKER